MRSVGFDADGKRFFTATFDHTARVWRVPKPRAWRLPFRVKVRDVQLLPKQSELVTALDDGKVHIRSVESSNMIGEELLHESSVQTLAVSEKNKLLVCGTSKGLVHVWNAASRQRVIKPFYHATEADPSPVRKVCVSPKGDMLATAGDDLVNSPLEYARGSTHGHCYLL